MAYIMEGKKYNYYKALRELKFLMDNPDYAEIYTKDIVHYIE